MTSRGSDNRRSGGRFMTVATAAGIALMIAIAVVLWHLPRWVFIVYLGASILTFILYAFDKHAAGKGGRRAPESTLHLLSLLGGWPGALIAQRILRHKSAKTSFQIMFWITTVINCAGFFILFRETATGLFGL